jgi:hypothetical protein
MVAVSACVLTVSIAGSIIYLSWKAYDRHRYRERVAAFVSSLEHRTDAELAANVEQLREKPKLARYILPEILKSVGQSRSERQQIAAIRVACAFLDHQRIRDALMDLRNSPRESVAAVAMEALSQVQPPQRAAELLGRATDVSTGAVIDEVCAGLVRLGDVGRTEMQRQLPRFSVDRRVWLVGYIVEHGGGDRSAWLQMLKTDPEARVSDAASKALSQT